MFPMKAWARTKKPSTKHFFAVFALQLDFTSPETFVESPVEPFFEGKGAACSAESSSN